MWKPSATKSENPRQWGRARKGPSPRQAGETLLDSGAEENLPLDAPSDRWSWVERRVWTKRMLCALEKGVKGGKWFSLMDKVYSPENLSAGFARVKKNRGAAGVDGQTIDVFTQREARYLDDLRRSLKEGTYAPLPARRCWIDKPGSAVKRPLGIPAVRDRVVQTASRSVLEPIFEIDFSDRSYGFRPGRSALDAVEEVERLLATGRTWVVDADLKAFFDTIDHDLLLERIKEKVGDGSVLDLVGRFLKQSVMDGLENWSSSLGTPQGAVISPLLSNIFLDPFDKAMAAEGFEMVRYADDFVLLCRDEAEAERALASVRSWVEANGLSLHPEKTRIVDACRKEDGGFDFLGYHFERGMKWPRAKSVKKFKTTIRLWTRRANANSLKVIIAKINRALRGWSNYFRFGFHTVFPKLDGWVRMRLRSIQRERRKGKGRGRGLDHFRWPNAFFDDLGLYSLTNAEGHQRSRSW